MDGRSFARSARAGLSGARLLRLSAQRARASHAFLRGDLHLSYAEGSLHTSAFALGMLAQASWVIGPSRSWPSPCHGMGTWRHGRGFAAAGGRARRHLTLAGACSWAAWAPWSLCCAGGACRRARTDRAVALSEANVLSSTFAMLAPMLVGGMARTALGWRSALLLASCYSCRWRYSCVIVTCLGDQAPHQRFA